MQPAEQRHQGLESISHTSIESSVSSGHGRWVFFIVFVVLFSMQHNQKISYFLNGRNMKGVGLGDSDFAFNAT